MNEKGCEVNESDDYHFSEPSYEGNSVIEEDRQNANDSQLSESFFNSLHEGFLGSKQQIGDVSMNYSNTNTSKLNMFSQRSSCPSKPPVQQQWKHEGEEEVISLNKRSALVLSQFEQTIQGQELQFSQYQEDVTSQWKSMVLTKMEFYRSELARFIKETEAQSQQNQAATIYYKNKLDNHMAQCSGSGEEINRLAGILQRKEEELEEAIKRVEVEYTMESLIGQVERNEREHTDRLQKEEMQRVIQEKVNVERELVVQSELYDKQLNEMKIGWEKRLEELQQKLLKQTNEIQQLKLREGQFKRKEQQLIEKVEDMEKHLKEKEEIKGELEKQTQQLKEELERIKLDNITSAKSAEVENDSKNVIEIAQQQLDAARKELEQKNELIVKLKRTLHRERLQRNGQSPTVLIKRQVTPTGIIVKENNGNVQVETEEGQQKNQAVEGEVEREIGQNVNHQKSLIKRKTKSIDLSNKQSNGGRLMNYSFQSGCDQSQSICMDISCSGQNNSIIGFEEKKPKRRSVSMMNSSMMSQHEEDKSILVVQENRVLLVRELKEVLRKREDIKEKIKKAKSEFEQQQQRKITKQEPKPWQESIDEYNVLSELMKELDQKIAQFDQSQSIHLQANSQDLHFASTNNQTTHNNSNNNNQSMLVDSQICKQINNSTISDISNNTTSTIRQPIFKSTNPLFSKHLGFSSSSYTHNSSIIDHNNQNTLLHNISANLADSSQILSQSVANASTATSHISHKSGDADIAKGLRLEIKNLQHANNLLREKLLNSKASHEYEQEIKNKEIKIEELTAEIALISQQRAVSEERVEEMQETIDILTVKLQSETKERRILHNIVEDMKGKIRVFCRVRPPSESELATGSPMVVEIQDNMTIQLQTKNGPKKFSFDSCLNFQSTQAEIFEDTKRLIQSAVDGYNVCIFAYGQTGSGKTFTMQGKQDEPGIVPRSINELFNLLKPIQKSCRVTVSTYIIELYQDTIIDLLNPQPRELQNKKLEIKEDQITGNTYIANVNIDQVTTKEELEQLVQKSILMRRVSKTDMNTESSRSHLVITILLSIYNPQTETTSHGKISLIDLAGSERIHKSGANSIQIKEAQAINKSLTALGDVISALTSPQQGGDNTRFVPYRNNKLTYLMKDSLGGNAKTLMFVNISPSEYNQEETQSSLFYASRVKNIVNDSVRNVETKEHTRLKEKLAVLTIENEKLQYQINSEHQLLLNNHSQQSAVQSHSNLQYATQQQHYSSQQQQQNSSTSHIISEQKQQQQYQNQQQQQHSKQPLFTFSNNLKQNIHEEHVPQSIISQKIPQNQQQQIPLKLNVLSGRANNNPSVGNSFKTQNNNVNINYSQQTVSNYQNQNQQQQQKLESQHIGNSQKENSFPQTNKSISQIPLAENRNFMNLAKSLGQNNYIPSSRSELNNGKS